MRAMTWISAIAVALFLFVGFWAFAYQGYQEDAGSKPLTTWPYGVAFYAAAAVIIFVMVRRRQPDLSVGGLVLVALAILLVGVLAALLSLDAGGQSFEF